MKEIDNGVLKRNHKSQLIWQPHGVHLLRTVDKSASGKVEKEPWTSSALVE